MPFDDLTRFLQAAADHGELLRIGDSVRSPGDVVELTEIVRRRHRERSPVVLFEHVGESSIPIVTNLLGNRERLLRSLGAVSVAEAADRVFQLLVPFAHRSGISSGGVGDRAGMFAPRVGRRGACQHVVQLGGDFDLRQLPTKQIRNGVERAALSSAAVLFRDVREGSRLVQLDLDVVAPNRLRIDGPIDPGLREAFEACRSRGRGLPVAVVQGGDPLLAYAAGQPLPDGLDPFRFLGGLRGEPLNLVRGRTVEIDVPADAEIVIEGYLEAESRDDTSGFAEKPGTGSIPNEPAILEVAAMTHRANPILPAWVPSERFDESFVWTELTERIALNWLRLWHPVLLGLHLPRYGSGPAAVFAQVDRCAAAERHALAHALLGSPLLAEAGAFVLVPGEADLEDTDAMFAAVLRGLAAGDAMPMGIPRQGTSSRFVIDVAASTIVNSSGSGEGETRYREILQKTGWPG